MKILLVSNLYPPYFIGGLELSAKRIADGLAKRGHDIYILTGKHEENNKVKESNIFRLLTIIKPYLKNISIFKKYYWIVKKELFNYTNYKIIRRVAEEIKPDIGYIWNLLDVSWSPALAMRSLRIPIVFHLGDYELKKLICYGNRASNLLFRYLKQAISKILLKALNPKYSIVTSKILKDEYLKAGLSPEKITVIHRGINTQLFKKQTVKRRESKVSFLYSGRLHEAKGVHTLIEAFSSLVKEYNHRNVFLNIVGGGVKEYEKRLIKIVEKQKIKDFVYFHKKVPFNKMPAVYNKNDILVIPSIWKEPFGLVTIEAMACGLAVIGTTSGGPKEVIQNGVTGLLVEPNNPEQLAQAMNRLVEDNRLREKMKAEGLKVVHKKFKTEMEVDAIEKYLLKIVNS